MEKEIISFTSMDEVLERIKKKLDTPSESVLMLYAQNASGKTRLSKLFCDRYKEKVLYYNAYTEDLFIWDNEEYALRIDTSIWIFQTIIDQGLDNDIVKNFKKFTGSKLEPALDFNHERSKGRKITERSKGEKITFSFLGGNDNNLKNIKISRGEESVFIWSIFYTVLDAVIDTLNEAVDNRSTDDFNNIQYVVIDDPVSSMDDARIITIALALKDLILKSTGENKLKFLITTHHALFFNIMFNALKYKGLKAYILSKSDENIHLKEQKKDSPFAYHHTLISEINRAIAHDDLKQYHFNIFRTLLEKTANFLGYSGGWGELLSQKEEQEAFIKALNHYSHGTSSELEHTNLDESDKKNFKEAFKRFMREFKWKHE